MRLAVAMMMAVLCGASALAQHDASQLRLQVLNGRTGKPVAHQKVVVMAGESSARRKTVKLVDVATDGEGYVSLPDAASQVERLHVYVEAYRSCSKAEVNSFELAKVAASGVVSENACRSRISLYPQPGNLVFFVRPETWLERMRK